MKLRGIVYLRRSTGKQAGSLEEQLDWAMDRARELGVFLDASKEMLAAAGKQGLHQIGDIYFDDALTGDDSSRLGFAAFLRRGLNDDSLTHCLAWSRDRFSRPELPEEAVVIEKKLLMGGRHTIFARGRCCKPRERFESTDGEDMDLRNEYSRAGAYRVELALAALRGQGKNAESGHSNGGTPPYGFVRACTRVGSDRVEIVPRGETRRGEELEQFWIPGEDAESLKKLEIVIWIFYVYLSGTHGLGRIARRLNDRGIPSPNAGRTRRDPRTGRSRLVSGKWTVSSVRGIIEQPLYMGVYAWGRTEQGSLYRYKKGAAGNSRVVRHDEVHGQNGTGKMGTGKKRVNRDYETWVTGSPAREFEPIVSPEDWLACNARLKKGAEQGGLRGKPHHTDPDKYPLRVICDNCKEPMSGTPYGGEPCYICSSYSNSHGELCCHGWVQRDLVVWFALRAIREKIEDSGSRAAIGAEIHSLLEEEARAQKGDAELLGLEQEAEDLLEARRRAYADMQSSTDPDRRDDAEVFYKGISGKLRAAQDKLATARSRCTIQGIDIEAETEATLAALDDLHKRLDDVPPGALRELFTTLGVTVTIRFEPGRVGQRRIIPVHAELRLGQDGGLTIPASTTPEGGDPEALGIVGRGDRI